MKIDDTGRRNDEAVRRLREESALRLEQQRRRQSFAGWCAMATLAGGISLAVLGARDARVRAEEERTAAIEAQRAVYRAACDTWRARRSAILHELDQTLAQAGSEEERALLRGNALRALDRVPRPPSRIWCGKDVAAALIAPKSITPPCANSRRRR